jgi:hypothetical protein
MNANYVACQSGFFAAFQVDNFCQAPFTCSARNMENPGGLEMSETSRPSLGNFMANMTISAERGDNSENPQLSR